ncbi:hypothetical protein BC938DRAFT_471734 [Jimgerdemannia flammicorona]|uniref:Uncharacterized protein n=1 Tax=Jimgerdemannia flammicorona TaxID=994334 RepID=A0A433Q7I6_9FUNG|nr:hypothetical protein BC938DRAFT_471734 [Jimgerdemannia flammicorona]
MGVIVFFGVIARRKLYGQKTLSAYFLLAHTLSQSNTESGFATRWTTRDLINMYLMWHDDEILSASSERATTKNCQEGVCKGVWCVLCSFECLH